MLRGLATRCFAEYEAMPESLSVLIAERPAAVGLPG